MDALEFCKTKKRMCETYVACKNCPLLCTMGDCLLGTTDLRLDKKIIDVVEKWGEEHHVKTRQGEFLRMFPNAKVNEDGILAICPKAIDVTLDFRCNEVAYLCDDCGKRYWLEEIE